MASGADSIFAIDFYGGVNHASVHGRFDFLGKLAEDGDWWAIAIAGAVDEILAPLESSCGRTVLFVDDQDFTVAIHPRVDQGGFELIDSRVALSHIALTAGKQNELGRLLDLANQRFAGIVICCVPEESRGMR